MRLMVADLIGNLIAEAPYQTLSFRRELGQAGGLRAVLPDTGHPIVRSDVLRIRGCTLWVLADDGEVMFGGDLTQVAGHSDHRKEPVLDIAAAGVQDELPRRYLETPLTLNNVRPHLAARQVWQAVHNTSPLVTESNILTFGAADYGAGSELTAELIPSEGLTLLRLLQDFGAHATAGYYLRNSYTQNSAGQFIGRTDLSVTPGTDTEIDLDGSRGVVTQWNLDGAETVRHVLVKAANPTGGTPLLATATANPPGTRLTRFESLNELPDTSLLDGRAADILARYSQPTSTAVIEAYDDPARTLVQDITPGDTVRVTIDTPYDSRVENHRVQTIDVNISEDHLRLTIGTASLDVGGHLSILSPHNQIWRRPEETAAQVRRVEAFIT